MKYQLKKIIKNHLVCSIFIVLFLGFFLENSHAETLVASESIYTRLPKWELGVNMGTFYVPDYPGSDQSRFRSVPLPYIVYRGEFIQSDQRGGLHGIFLNNDLLDVDLSADTAFPTGGDENAARAGMPGLGWMFELGPQLRIHLYRSALTKLDMGFATRAVYSIDANAQLNTRGFDFYPNLRLHERLPFRRSFVECIFSGLWATDKLTQYFYGVPREYETHDRPSYDAHPGFLGESVSGVYVQSLDQDWSIYLGATKNYYSESANRASPLMRSIESETYFVGFYYSSIKSEKKLAIAE